MKRTVKTGPKRLRWHRRDWSGTGGYGQVRRWGSTVGNFKREREAKKLREIDALESRDARDPATYAPATTRDRDVRGVRETSSSRSQVEGSRENYV